MNQKKKKKPYNAVQSPNLIGDPMILLFISDLNGRKNAE